jgi:metal-sulfur cluster biosynthetic enzyme
MDLKDFLVGSVEKITGDFSTKQVSDIQSKTCVKEQVISVLRLIYDPEMSVNIFDLGLIYNIGVRENQIIIEMTLTSVTCPAVDWILQDVKNKICKYVKNIQHVEINLVWQPQWNRSMMSEEAKFILGLE